MPEDSRHASEDMLRRFFRSELPRRDTTELIQHLITRCPQLRGIGLFAELEEEKRENRLEMIRDNPRFHSWGLFTRLMGKSREYSLDDPEGGVHLAKLALAVVELLDSREFKPALLADYRTSALGTLANAKRLAADFEGAKAALRSACGPVGMPALPGATPTRQSCLDRAWSPGGGPDALPALTPCHVPPP